MDSKNQIKPSVLIVDDIPENIKVISNALYQEGLSISIAKSGTQALAIINKKQPDLILLDIAMPEMDGFEVCKTIKANKSTAHIPIIFLTAKIETKDIIKGFDYGAVDYITKPVKIQELLSRVKTHIDLQLKTKQLKEVNLTLENRVKERTLELENAYNRLEKLDNAKSDFLRLINHELRTPLNAIIGFLQVLEMQNKSEEQAEFIKIINQSASSLLKLSESALLITSIRADKYEIQMEPYCINSIINEVLMSYYTISENKGINLLTNISEEKYYAFLDRKLINTALSLILDNAFRYTPKGKGIALNLYAEKESIKIEITDGGKGFSPDALDNLFDFFSSNDINHYSEGFGLGLATSKLIMESLNGEISASNSPYGGAIVQLTLARVDPPKRNR